MTDEREATPFWYRPAAGATMAIGVVLRSWLVWAGRGTARFLKPDSRSYRAFADHLPASLWSPPAGILRNAVDRGPGYPIFIRLVSPFGAHANVVAIVVAQCIVGGAVSVWLAIELGRRLFNPAAAVVAGLLLATDPLSIGHATLVLSETVFTALLLGTLVAFERTVRTRSARWAASTGALFAASLFVRPTLLYFTPLLAIGLFAALRTKQAATLGLVALAVAVAPIGAWYARNAHVMGEYTFTTIEGFNLFEFRAAGAVSAEEHITLDAARAQLQSKYATDLATTNLARLDAARRRDGIREIVHHPRGYVSIAVRALGRTAVGTGAPYIARQLPRPLTRATGLTIMRWSIADTVLMYALAVAGVAVAMARRKWFALALLGVPAVLYLVTSAGPEMYARFRVPVQPMLCVFAGAGAVAMFEAFAVAFARRRREVIA